MANSIGMFVSQFGNIILQELEGSVPTQLYVIDEEVDGVKNILILANAETETYSISGLMITGCWKQGMRKEKIVRNFIL